MKKVLSLGFLLLLGCQSETRTDAVNKGEGVAAVGKDTVSLYQGLSESAIIGTTRNQIVSTDTISDNLYLTRYIGDNRFLGTVIWTMVRGRFNPIWQLKDSSDFPPHTYSFVDYNSDGKKDVTILSGQEDVFSTDVYLNKSTTTYSTDNFESVHRNWNNYSVIVDLDGDGVPELLDSGNEQVEPEERPEFFLSDDVKSEIDRKYVEIAQVKGANNFHFNMPQRFRVSNSFLMDSIKVMGCEDEKFIDKTCNYQDYLDWRIGILEQLEKDSRNDTKYVNALISYHKRRKGCK
ncbi:FG-GAP repeat domain-containing protein [Pontibacter akesuensis]|nr:VCBS repeat-containing protein [Pontibacter akesuensis]GHA78567.1 hypothetical protein GCM10007389_35950 [Pontibacter akesuensis]